MNFSLALNICKSHAKNIKCCLQRKSRFYVVFVYYEKKILYCFVHNAFCNIIISAFYSAKKNQKKVFAYTHEYCYYFLILQNFFFILFLWRLMYAKYLHFIMHMYTVFFYTLFHISYFFFRMQISFLFKLHIFFSRCRLLCACLLMCVAINRNKILIIKKIHIKVYTFK